jgi:hypothetical protein
MYRSCAQLIIKEMAVYSDATPFDSHHFRPWHFDEIQAVMKVKAEVKAKHIEKRNVALKRAETSSET